MCIKRLRWVLDDLQVENSKDTLKITPLKAYTDEYTYEYLPIQFYLIPVIVNNKIDYEWKIDENLVPFEQSPIVEYLKRSAKTLIYIKDSGIDSYEELEQKCSAACGKAMAIQNKIRNLADKQTAINELQKQIGTYGKTRAVYKQWLASGKDLDFYEAYRADIALHQAANQNFKDLCAAKSNALHMLCLLICVSGDIVLVFSGFGTLHLHQMRNV